MAVIFEGLVHVVLFLSALGQLLLIYFVIFKFSASSNVQEIIMRSLAVSCGLLMYVASKALGLSLPDVTFKALATSFPIAIGLAGIILPSITGLIIAWYVIRYLNSRSALRNIVGMRILTLMITFVFFLYCDSYIASVSINRRGEFTYLLPNVSFVLAVLLYSIFKYHPNIVRHIGGYEETPYEPESNMDEADRPQSRSRA